MWFSNWRGCCSGLQESHRHGPSLGRQVRPGQEGFLEGMIDIEDFTNSGTLKC